MHFLDLESNMPSYEYTDNVKEISSVSLIEKICSNYIWTQVLLTKKLPPPLQKLQKFRQTQW